MTAEPLATSAYLPDRCIVPPFHLCPLHHLPHAFCRLPLPRHRRECSFFRSGELVPVGKDLLRDRGVRSRWGSSSGAGGSFPELFWLKESPEGRQLWGRGKGETLVGRMVLLTMLCSNVSGMEGNSQIGKERRVRTLEIGGRASSPLCPSSRPLYHISLISSSPRLMSPSSFSSSSSVFLLRERGARYLCCSQRKT